VFFKNDPQYTQFGYFDVNGSKTFSKYEAWQLSQQQNASVDDVKFIFNDDKMSQLDWSIEPSASLDELYAQRARQLREKYDYLVLFYSGGIDSHVILNAFYRNNIKIDEIITIGNRAYLDDKAKINQEVFNKAIPYLDLINLKRFGTKQTYIDIGQLIIDQFNNPFHFENFMYYHNGPLSPWYMAYRSPMFKLQNQSHVDISNSGRKIGYMFGYDKPNMFAIDGNWCFKYTDSVSDFGVRPYAFKEMLGGALVNYHDEPFFVTPELPEMTIKQCHVITKMMNSMTSFQDVRLCPVEDIANTGPFIEHPIGSSRISGRWIKKKELERVIYPSEDPDSFGNDKVGGSVMFTARDKWFFQSKFESRNNLIKKYKVLLREQPGYFKYADDDFPINSISFYSKPYIIDKITNLKKDRL
jgi:hypothetical protein